MDKKVYICKKTNRSVAMSEQFYEKFLSMFSSFIVLVFIFLIGAELMFFYSLSGNFIFYYSSIGVFAIVIIYAARYLQHFRDFQQNLNLFIPNQTEPIKPLEPLKIEDLQNKSLKACLFYRNGATYDYVTKALQLGKSTSRFRSAEQGKREVIKGLDILLRFYNEHNEKKVTPF